MECLQSYLPLRVASNVDLGFNALGGALGALGAAVLDRLGAIEQGRRVRSRWFAHDARGALVARQSFDKLNFVKPAMPPLDAVAGLERRAPARAISSDPTHGAEPRI